jgi:hypothetical protein
MGQGAHVDVSFVRAKDGAPYPDLGPAWPGFNAALADAVGSLPPRGSAERTISTYWIDRTLASVLRMISTGESGSLQGGNATRLAVAGGQVVASSDYEAFDDEVLPAQDFERVLRAWRNEVVRVRSAEEPFIPDTYRHPYSD